MSRNHVRIMLDLPQVQRKESAVMPSSHYERAQVEFGDHVHTDFEEDESESEHNSLQSSNQSLHDRRRSDTTASSFEISTPQSEHHDFYFKPVQGPQGPHLFRNSQSSLDFVLQLSPVDAAAQRTRHSRTISINTNIPGLPINIHDWSSQDVTDWMFSAGFDMSIVDSFDSNDITGTVLADMTFDDLKDLGILSFGKRHQIWTAILSLRAGEAGPSPISRESAAAIDPHNPAAISTAYDAHEHSSTDVEDIEPVPASVRRGKSTRRSKPPTLDLSECIAIEDELPPEHTCRRGHDCNEWKKWHRMTIRAQKFSQKLKADMALKYPAIPTPSSNRASFPSIIASSNALTPGQLPAMALHQAMVQRLEVRDPKENIETYLELQHLTSPIQYHNDPKLEVFPPTFHQPARASLQRPHIVALPKLSIPAGISPRQRAGTPASEVDVPLSAPPLGTVQRDFSQSVPPDMQYRHPATLARSSSVCERQRPSLALRPVPEGQVLSPIHTSFDNSDTRIPEHERMYGNNCSRAGYMKKRKTKLLRHEWQEAHFRLQGTQLAMHTNARQTSRKLDTIDVDQYSINCSATASNSKLTAALKSLRIKDDKKADVAAFAFQLVPGRHDKLRTRTHHFAVNGRDERVDWMRDLMLAKVKEQGSHGYAIQVNGT